MIKAPTTTIVPTMKIRKAAGPSPTLKLSKLSPQLWQRLAKRTHPWKSVRAPHCGQRPQKAEAAGEGSVTSPSPLTVRGRAPAAPHVNRREQEQPHDVDEVPVPGGRLKAEMLPRREVALVCADQANDQEDGSDDDVEAVEPGHHEEGRPVDTAFERERRVGVLVGLDAGEQQSEQDRHPEPELQSATVAVDQ